MRFSSITILLSLLINNFSNNFDITNSNDIKELGLQELGVCGGLPHFDSNIISATVHKEVL